MKAEVISIGTELLMGELTDTNASFIASQLPALGIDLQWITQVGDDLDILAEAFTRALTRSDIVFSSGGLGPTQDDLTREAIAKAMGEEMEVRDDLLKHLKDFFRNRGIDMPATNLKQATLIPSADTIPNRKGTAPGWWVECTQNGVARTIVSMPGPPGELQGIWEEQVVPRLHHPSYERRRGQVILTRNIKTHGLSEGGLDEMVSEYLGKENPYLGIYAKSDGIHLRIIARAASEDTARGLIRQMERGLVSIVGPYIWGYGEETPEGTAGHLLTKNHLTLATMESCTGGLLASKITEVHNSAAYFKGGLVVYDSGSAEATGVPHRVIEEHGIVSQEAAEAMARTARDRLNADIGIGVTGVAGPDEIEGKPVGTLHVAIALPSEAGEDVRHFPSRVPPRRTLVKLRAVSSSLIELRRILETA